MSFNNIGYFQLDNLLQSRIPFMLVMLDEVDLKSWYNSLIQLHIQNISLICEAKSAVTAIQEKKLPPHHAIIIIDNDESKSPQIVTSLERAGFTNIFYVKGGYKGLLAERQQASAT